MVCCLAFAYTTNSGNMEGKGSMYVRITHIAIWDCDGKVQVGFVQALLCHGWPIAEISPCLHALPPSALLIYYRYIFSVVRVIRFSHNATSKARPGPGCQK